MQPTISEHIEITPGTCGGVPRIAGHRIRVQDIYVWHELQGMSPAEIITEFPQLTLSDVHAALTYYFDHVDEIRRDMEEEKELERRLILENPPKLPQKLAGKDADANQVSS